eukprot:Hpha_TRINITY_DN14093_c0_g2::TRINITY_DN14093_c0_g2_i1::g.44147::m.44147
MKQSRRAKEDASGRANRVVNLQRRIAAAGEKTDVVKSDVVKADVPLTARGQSAERKKASPTGRPATAPRPNSPRVASAGAQQPRQELKSSLVSHASRSHYCSMFPPLFSPYDRASGTRMMRGWGSGVQEYYKHMSSDGTAPPEAGTGASPRVSVSPHKAAVVDVQVPKPSPVKRPRGLAGQPGFYPTGTTVNALRHFTNYRLAIESEQEMRAAVAAASKKQAGAAGSAAAGGRSLQQVLRAQRSVRTAGATRPEGAVPTSAGGLWPQLGAEQPPPEAEAEVRLSPAPTGPVEPAAGAEGGIGDYVARLAADRDQSQGGPAPPGPPAGAETSVPPPVRGPDAVD